MILRPRHSEKFCKLVEKIINEHTYFEFVVHNVNATFDSLEKYDKQFSIPMHHRDLFVEHITRKWLDFYPAEEEWNFYATELSGGSHDLIRVKIVIPSKWCWWKKTGTVVVECPDHVCQTSFSPSLDLIQYVLQIAMSRYVKIKAKEC